MGYFLRSVRRSELVRYLTSLSVPSHIASGIAAHNDDVAALDRYLAGLVQHVDQRAHKLFESLGDQEAYEKQRTFLYIELEVFGTYKAEIDERGLERQFPLTDTAVAMSLKAIAEMRGAIQ